MASGTKATLQQAVNTSALLMESNIKKEIQSTVTDTGILASSVITTTGTLRAEVGPTVDYGIYVEKGTDPHFPPISAISPWAKRHGIDPFALQQSIGKKGTEANPFFERAVKDSISGVKTIFEKAIGSIIDL